MAGPDLTRARAAVVSAGVRLGARGLVVAAEGNVSVRLEGDTLLITPSGRRKDELAPEDLLVVALEPGARAPGGSAPGAARPSSDVAIHRAIYRARPDVLAVVHAHVPAAMALTVAGLAPDPSELPETALLLPRLPVVPFGAMGSEELAERVASALAAGPEPLPRAALLERHGAVSIGAARGQRREPDPIAALAAGLEAMELVDVLCRVWRDAVLLRAAAGGGERY
ncbi:MAG TPA: class II aldolase/adducin family protein [Candidatus Limnocylindrales bacterium]|nr:class II aldolase/adducin family protein [Candidatus Limnocylindrales bacterium]